MKKPMVWIISYFAGGPSYCPRIPDYSLAKYLREHGYDALVFAGSALHNTETNRGWRSLCVCAHKVIRQQKRGVVEFCGFLSEHDEMLQTF